MRDLALGLALLVTCFASAPAAAAPFGSVPLLGFTARDVGPSRSTLLLNVNDLQDQEIDAFETLDFAVERFFYRIERPSGSGASLTIGSGRIQISGGLVSAGATFLIGAPALFPGPAVLEEPIPEPGAALLFAVGSVLVGLRLRRRR